MSTNPPFVRALFSLGLLLATVLLGGCVKDQQVVAQADQLHQGLEPAVMTDPQLASYMQQVGDRIIAAARQLDAQGFGPESHRSEDTSWMFSQQMQFHLVNSKTLNAFTTGGDHMYIYNELFQNCKDEDELAAVMAHEYGHVYARHVAKGMNRQYAMLGVAGAAGAAGYAAGGKDQGASYASMAAGATLAAAQFVGMGFTRKDENQADELGFAFYTHAGWDPNQFAGFFRTMIEKGYDKTPGMLSDHPTLASRVEETEQRVAQLPPEARSWRRPPVADPNQFHQLQARANQVAQTMPDDKTLAKAQQLLNAFPSCVAAVEAPQQIQAQQQVATEAQQMAQPPKDRRK